jgi:hypothetical protein
MRSWPNLRSCPAFASFAFVECEVGMLTTRPRRSVLLRCSAFTDEVERNSLIPGSRQELIISLFLWSDT